MGLKDRLQAIPSGPRIPNRPKALKIMWKRVKPLFSDITPMKPAPFDLLNAYEEALRAKKSYGSVTHASLKALRMLPWVLFRYPEEHPTKLGDDPQIVRDYMRWLLQQDNARVLASLLHNFLLYYPSTSVTFELWRNGLLKALGQTQRPRLQRSSERVKQYGLLETDSPKRIAQLLIDDERSPNDILSDAGLGETLAQGHFARSSYLEALNILDKALRYNQNAQKAFTRIKKLSQPESSGYGEPLLRFPKERVQLSETMLMPYAGGNAAPELKEDIRAFLINISGDPRIQKEHWAGVREEAQRVILRWLVTTTLEDFFSILDKTADDIWRFRKAFWGAYLEMGVIDEAWVVLGKQAKIRARGFVKSESYGELVRPHTKNQSVLLMKIRDLTIAEWSHNGTCRIWTEEKSENPYVPVLYGPVYEAEALRAPCFWHRTHHGSVTGKWQEDIRNFIRREENINAPLNRIMPDHV